MNLSNVTTFDDPPRSSFFSPEYYAFNKAFSLLMQVTAKKQGLTVQFRSFLSRARLYKSALDRVVYDPQSKKGCSGSSTGASSALTYLASQLQEIATFSQLDLLTEEIQQAALAAFDTFESYAQNCTNMSVSRLESTRDFLSYRRARLSDLHGLVRRINVGEDVQVDIEQIKRAAQLYREQSDNMIAELQRQNGDLRREFARGKESIEMHYSRRIEMLEGEIQRLKQLLKSEVLRQ